MSWAKDLCDPQQKGPCHHDKGPDLASRGQGKLAQEHQELFDHVGCHGPDQPLDHENQSEAEAEGRDQFDAAPVVGAGAGAGVPSADFRNLKNSESGDSTMLELPPFRARA